MFSFPKLAIIVFLLFMCDVAYGIALELAITSITATAVVLV